MGVLCVDGMPYRIINAREPAANAYDGKFIHEIGQSQGNSGQQRSCITHSGKKFEPNRFCVSSRKSAKSC